MAGLRQRCKFVAGDRYGFGPIVADSVFNPPVFKRTHYRTKSPEASAFRAMIRVTSRAQVRSRKVISFMPVGPIDFRQLVGSAPHRGIMLNPASPTSASCLDP